MQLLPSIQLMSIIRHYLVLESSQPGSFQHRLLPDGSTGLVLYYNSTAAAPDQPSVMQTSFYYGPIRHFRDVSFSGNLHLLVVVLQPAGIHGLTGMAAHELSNHIISLSDLWGSDGRLLDEQVNQARNTEERIRCVDFFLLKRLQNVSPVNRSVISVLQLLQQSGGSLPVKELTQRTGIGERQLERLFHQYIGLSPKQFAAIVKLQRTLKLLQHKTTHERLTDITYDAGYFDQAHFIREFKKQAGLPPKQYLGSTIRLALNFIRLVDGNA